MCTGTRIRKIVDLPLRQCKTEDCGPTAVNTKKKKNCQSRILYPVFKNEGKTKTTQTCKHR